MHTLSHRSRSQNRSQRYTHNQIEYHELDKTFKGVRKTFVTIMKCYMYELILAGILVFYNIFHFQYNYYFANVRFIFLFADIWCYVLVE